MRLCGLVEFLRTDLLVEAIRAGSDDCGGNAITGVEIRDEVVLGDVDMTKDSNEVKLASNWSVKRVSDCLNAGQKHELIQFLSDRHRERFFEPIEILQGAKSSGRGFGFAIMALCSLLIETIESYKKGLPTSNRADFDDLFEGIDILPYKKDDIKKEIKDSRQMFEDFFKDLENKACFPDVNGGLFFQKIRCGLLHQAQTKGGWRIIRSGKYWDETSLSINRDEFAVRLRKCFDRFLKHLEMTEWGEGVWPMVMRKIFLLTKSS